MVLCFQTTATARSRRPSSVVSSDSSASSIWDGSFNANLNVDSYLTAGRPSEVENLLKIIHANQFPGRSKCYSRRLQLLDMSDASFEGIGSVLREIMFALAIALHSNRTLIWGLHMPMLFKYSHELLINYDEYESLKLSIPTGELSMVLNCKANNIGDYISGPYRCFFRPISSCSLDDVSHQELVDYGSGKQFDDHSRLMRTDLRRSIALYHPPFDLYNYLSKVQTVSSSVTLHEALTKQYHVWSAAVAAFVFRLKTDIIRSFIARNKELFPFTGALLDTVGRTSTSGRQGTVWGIHIRHGDLRANRRIYPYKRVFEFNEYFEAARVHSHKVRQSPEYLYVATDSDDISGLHTVYGEFTDLLTMEGWYDNKVPSLIVLSNKRRYRTPLGSHAVAAGGGCVVEAKLAKEGLKRCTILPEEAGKHVLTDVPRSEMMLRIMVESIEDIYLLSLCDIVIGSGSSYYSSVSALLMWAHPTVTPVSIVYSDRVLFLDQSQIDNGHIPTAYLPFDHRVDTRDDDPNTLLTSGSLKWEFETTSFITGLKDSQFQYAGLDINPWSPDYRMAMHNKLPQLPDKLFYLESNAWLADRPYAPVLRGHCPLPFAPKHSSDRRTGGKIVEELLEYVTSVVNLGVEHYQAEHPNMALKCWYQAADALDQYAAGSQDPRIREAYEIATENAATFQSSVYVQARQHIHNLRSYVNLLLNKEALEMKTGEYYERANNFRVAADNNLKIASDNGINAAQYKAVPMDSLNDGEISWRLDQAKAQKPFDYFFRRHQKNEEEKHKFRGIDDLVEEAALLERELMGRLAAKSAVASMY
jgi:hypothetical protein